ncbi:Rz1-like lysis system protein LysC [Sodalis ligni]|uniref:Rz1-like lysis system protein LysC n=1 Tax=Sodalis ligni TaxID=2697027 RepID=UPI003C7BFE23
MKVPTVPLPASLTAPCPPSPPPNDPLTYGAALAWDELLLTDLQNCNEQLSAIRQIEIERQK